MTSLLPWIATLGCLISGVFIASPIAAQVGSVEETAGNKVRQGMAVLEAGDLESAEALFKEALALEPRRPFRIWHLLGRVELLRRDGVRAQMSFDQALNLAPRFGLALLGRARAAVLLGELDRALEDLETAAELPATSAEASLLAGQLLIYLRRFDEARRYLAESSMDERPIARWLLLAIDDSELAGRHLRVELGRHLHVPSAYLALGVFYLRAGDVERAEPALRIALAMAENPSIPTLFLERLDGPARSDASKLDLRWKKRWAVALEHAHAGRSRESLRVSEELLAHRPYFVPARLLLIDDAEETGDAWRAMKGYRQLLHWLPSLPVLLARRARLAHSMGASALAEQSVREALESLPEDGALQHLLASILADSGRWDAAFDASQKALELGFESSHAYVTMGNIHQAEMRISDAAAAYTRALELDPGGVEVLSSSALSTLLTEDFSGLALELQRHLEVHPESVNALHILALMSLRKNELETSKGYFQQLASLAPNRSEAHYNLGLIHQREGNEGDAQAAMQRFRVLKAQEDEEFLKHNRAHFLRLEAEQAAAVGETMRAVGGYNRIVSDGVGNVADFLALAAAWLRLGDGAKAFEWYESVLEAEPYHREALEGLAAAAERIGRGEQAKHYRERVELLTP